MKNIEYQDYSVSNFKLNGFATGAYQCHCSSCKKKFIGDKRSIICLECAIQISDKNQKLIHIYDELENWALENQQHNETVMHIFDKIRKQNE